MKVNKENASMSIIKIICLSIILILISGIGVMAVNVNLKDVTIVHEILPIITMNFTKSTATLIITVQEMFDSFMLILGDKTYTVTEFEVSGRRITCNIDYVYNGETKIGVRPLPSDIYNKYTGNVTYIDVI